ncbi:hypothetical protein O6H91_Y136200 [Diphasiastrum complanatum]|nr:hypothetical protein O6H91_Y136200 [Diphasiastrum complanatum]
MLQLRHMKENPGSQVTTVPNVVPKSASVNVDRATPFVQAAPLPSNVASANEDVHDEIVDVEHEGDGRSIYVKNLPMSITASELHEEFVRFGPIKSNGINVRSQKQQGFCYAFLEFEDANAAQNAIDASPIIIGGRPAHIQEKKPGSSRATGGRLPLGRPYRPDSGRGRPYFGGRGQGRAPGQDRERDPYFRGRGSGVMRGGYNGSQNVNVAAKTASSKSIK